ncbi:MAG: hypothetical protein QXR96_00930 [Candidatus Woesearchaeota archaeon]
MRNKKTLIEDYNIEMNKINKKELETNKTLNYYKLIAVFAITTLIFISGILIGNFFTNKKIDKIIMFENNIKNNFEATEIQYLLLTQEPCNTDTILITKELEEIGSKITYMENMLGFDNNEVMDLKNSYSLIQLKHYLLLKKIDKECNEKFNFILYFYSNKGDCPKCEQQGFILDYIKKKYNNTMIYAFDINNDNNALKTIKNKYKIEKTPGLIINENVFQKFLETEEIEDLLIKR